MVRSIKGNRCSVYGRPERPILCGYYDALKCQYKPRFGQPRPNGFLRVRLEHFDWLAECFTFDEAGSILAMPPVDDVRRHLEARWAEPGPLASAPA